MLELRDPPPHGLGRTPGPLTLLDDLHPDPALPESRVKLPCSTRTGWKILTPHQRIPPAVQSIAEPEERPAPGVEWGLDFQEVSRVPADPLGKPQPGVEILNLVDHGSSVGVASEPASDYHAETALRAVAEGLVEQGCPDRIRLDRDTRWVGSWTAKDFPSPLLRFLQCLGIEPRVCPPQRPDHTVPVPFRENPFVERYPRSFQYECQLIECPADLVSTVEVNRHYVHFYNFERPNQAVTCGNQPPRRKFPEKPGLPPVPDNRRSGPLVIDPERENLPTQAGRQRLFSAGPSNLLRAANPTRTGGRDLGRWPAEDLPCICQSSAGQKSADPRIAKSSHELSGISGLDV